MNSQRLKIRRQPYFGLFVESAKVAEQGTKSPVMGQPFIFRLIDEEKDLTPEDAPYRADYFAFLDRMREIVQSGPEIGPDTEIGPDEGSGSDIISGLTDGPPDPTY